MKTNIVITGEPKSGKSTLLRKIISRFPNKLGFVTNEVLEDGERIGFTVENYRGSKVKLASVSAETPQKVGKYFVDSEGFDAILPEVSDFTDQNFLYIDEIGQMQLFSDVFKNTVRSYLDSKNVSLMTLSCIFEDDFIKEIKKRSDIILIKLSAENREEKEVFINGLLKKLEKAKKYVLEPERFTITGSKVALKSKHDTRNLVFEDGKWVCSCDFFEQHGICSHVIATEEFVK